MSESGLSTSTRRAWQRLLALRHGTPLYRFSLDSRAPEALVAAPPDPWSGRPELGNAMFQGQFLFAGSEASAPNQAPWRLRPDDAAWTAEIHAFDWLRHFAAVGGQAGEAHARKLVRSWIELCGEWENQVWAPDVLARRILAWVGHADFLLGAADNAFRRDFLASLATQYRHLRRVETLARPGREILAVAAALVVGGIALPNAGRSRRAGIALLETEISRAIRPDGGHESRSPGEMHAVLRELVRVGEALRAVEIETPALLGQAIERMAPMLRALRHGDGGLALFNGGEEETAEAIDVTLARAASNGEPLLDASHSGFQRLVARRSTLIVDTGPPEGTVVTENQHAGALAFEFSVGEHRMVVNCGGAGWRGPEWRAAMRVTAAHSTAVLGETNNLPPSLALDRPIRAPAREVARNDDTAGNQWLEMRHFGYHDHFRASHQRRLYLDAAGRDLRGEDRFVRESAGEALAFQIRFHLHPDVQAAPVRGGGHVLLKLPGGSGWRFLASEADVALEESVYLGRSDAVRRGRQIVVSGVLDGAVAGVKWAFQVT